MKKKMIGVTVAAAAGVILLGGTVVFAVNSTGRQKVKVISVSELSGYYGGGSGFSTSGNITSDVSQNVYLTDDQTVEEIFVSEGDTVKEGDPLISYDMTMTNLELEMKKLDRQGVELNIRKAREDIRKLKNAKPIQEGGGEFFDPGIEEGFPAEDFPEEMPPEELPAEEIPETVKALEVLDGESSPYMGEGTLENPYHFLCSQGGVIKGSFLNAMASQGCFFVIEIRQGDVSTGELMKIWGQKIAGEDGTFDPEARYVLDLGILAEPEEIRNPDAFSSLTAESVAEEKWCTGNGTEEKPYIFLVTPDGTVTGGFFNKMRENGGYFRIEVREGNTCKGALIKAWEQSGKALVQVEDDEIFLVNLTEGEPAPSPEPTQEPSPEPTGEPGPEPTGTPEPSPSAAPEPTSTPEPPVGTPEPTPSPKPTQEPVPEPTETPTPDPTEPPAAPEAAQPEEQPAPEEAGTSAVAFAEEARGTADAGSHPAAQTAVFRKSGDLSVRKVDTDQENDSNTVDSMMNSAGSFMGSVSDGTMTREEIQNQIKEKEKEIRGYQLDLKEKDLEIRSIEKTLKNQTVTSTLNGVVKTVGDPEKESGGQPLIQVVSSEGLYIQGTIGELQLDRLQVGQLLNGYCYDNGVSFTAQVKEISPYPAEGWGDPQSSQYPFTAYIENAEGLNNNSYAELTASDMGMDQGTVTLEKAFVRTEDGQYYVMKENEKGRLEKQIVQIARVVDSAYELSSGVTYEDKLAFPYGKNVVEGAVCEDGTMQDLYR